MPRTCALRCHAAGVRCATWESLVWASVRASTHRLTGRGAVVQIPVVPRCVDVISVKRYRAASRVAVTNVRMLSYGRHDDDGRISSTYSSYSRSRATFYELTHSAVTKIRLQHTQHHVTIHDTGYLAERASAVLAVYARANRTPKATKVASSERTSETGCRAA